MKHTAKKMAAVTFLALLMSGWGIAAQAQVCYSANCMMQLQEANDPAYQAAIHGGWYGSAYPYTAAYSYSSYPYYGYPYSAYTYYPGYQNQYSYQYQYQYQYWNQPMYPQPTYYWWNG